MQSKCSNKTDVLHINFGRDADGYYWEAVCRPARGYNDDGGDGAAKAAQVVAWLYRLTEESEWRLLKIQCMRKAEHDLDPRHKRHHETDHD